ncbi:MauE/DoxX family redox-associated membrane protein [Couchioplanes azureus]|uniref:MauE/DoxX family redox-associated membrane protein n=1 Tax=Couchioplanes caeruleus TaxID=56438 RepID=UPI0016716560|nr:MauE/DoxX family redox-associated membrane protein [Couchioplanes caeruleus]
MVRLLTAALLIHAAAQKLTAPAAIRLTLTTLRMPFPRFSGAALGVAELAAAVLLLVVPRSGVTAAMVIALGASFAGAAMVALARGEPVRCACFGRESQATLGWTQLVLFPVWPAVAWVTHTASSEHVVGVRWVAVTGLAVSVSVAVRRLSPLAWRSWRYLKVLEGQWASSGSSSPH